MKVEALIDRFGAEGQRAWELSNGIDNRPLIPLKQEESAAEHLALPFASASMELLLTAVDTLLSRAYARPGMQGRYAGGVVMECVLYRAHPWRKEIHFKQAAGGWRQASRIVRGQLEADHPQAPVEEVYLALSGITAEAGRPLEYRHNLRAYIAGPAGTGMHHGSCHCHAHGELGTGKPGNKTSSDTRSIPVTIQQSAVQPILSPKSFRYALIQPAGQENSSDAENRSQGVHLSGGFRDKRHAITGGAEQGGHRAGRCAQAAGRRRVGRLRPLAGDAGIHHR